MEPKWVHLWVNLKDALDTCCPRKVRPEVAVHTRVNELRKTTEPPRASVESVIKRWAMLHKGKDLADEVANYAREYVRHCFPGRKETQSTSRANGRLAVELHVPQQDPDVSALK